MPHKQRRRYFPASGDNNMDWDFRQIVHIVENVVAFIKTKEVLRDPKDRRKILLGLLSGDNEIWISVTKKHRKRFPAVRILIHEAMHILYPRFVRERDLDQKEAILYKRFTEEQRAFLRNHVPKRTSVREPEDKELTYYPKGLPFAL